MRAAGIGDRYLTARAFPRLREGTFIEAWMLGVRVTARCYSPAFGRRLSLRVRADASFNDDRKFLHLQMTMLR